MLSDDVSRNGLLGDVATRVMWRTTDRLDFPNLGMFPYFNFRSESEQAKLREPACVSSGQPGKRRSKQASLRRAVSTAYYALFHLLIDEAVGKWGDTSQDYLLQLFLPKMPRA
jgi:hypothetical protein